MQRFEMDAEQPEKLTTVSFFNVFHFPSPDTLFLSVVLEVELVVASSIL